jgi:IS5 family transposase
MKVYVSGQKRGLTEAIKRDLRRRSAVEPVIGHAKGEHRIGRNFFKGAHDDAANAVLAAAGYNFRRLLAWLAILWRAIIVAMLADALDAAWHGRLLMLAYSKACARTAGGRRSSR